MNAMLEARLNASARSGRGRHSRSSSAIWQVRATTKVKQVAAMLKAIHAQEDRQAARSKADDVAAKLEALKLTKAAQIVREGVEETLSYMRFPTEHWRQHEQSLGTHHAGDPSTHARGGRVPGRSFCLDARGRQATSHRGNAVGNAEVLGHGSAARTGARGTDHGNRRSCVNSAAAPLGEQRRRATSSQGQSQIQCAHLDRHYPAAFFVLRRSHGRSLSGFSTGMNRRG